MAVGAENAPRFLEEMPQRVLAYSNAASQMGKDSSRMKMNTLVLLKDELSPPLTWHSARVEQVYLGSVGTVRVLTVKTTNCSFRRSTNKLCPSSLEIKF